MVDFQASYVSSLQGHDPLVWFPPFGRQRPYFKLSVAWIVYVHAIRPFFFCGRSLEIRRFCLLETFTIIRYHPWDWYIYHYLSTWLVDFMVNVGKCGYISLRSHPQYTPGRYQKDVKIPTVYVSEFLSNCGGEFGKIWGIFPGYVGQFIK